MRSTGRGQRSSSAAAQDAAKLATVTAMDDRLPVSHEDEALLRHAYAAFNARDVDAAVALMDPHVDWPNALDGGRVHGRDGVCAYWQRQFAALDPQVAPERFTRERDGGIAVDVHQIVRDLRGTLLADRMVQHVYRIRDGLVTHMEIRE